MLLTIISSLLISLSIRLILTHSPLTMGIWVLLIAFSISLLTGLIFSSWFAFIIFLIYIGGILVIFAYFAALTPNQPLTINLSLIFIIITWLILVITFINYKLVISTTTRYITNLAYYPITIIYSFSNSLIVLVLASILFFILVAVVKITKLTAGPLRPFN